MSRLFPFKQNAGPTFKKGTLLNSSALDLNNPNYLFTHTVLYKQTFPIVFLMKIKVEDKGDAAK